MAIIPGLPEQSSCLVGQSSIIPELPEQSSCLGQGLGSQLCQKAAPGWCCPEEKEGMGAHTTAEPAHPAGSSQGSTLKSV